MGSNMDPLENPPGAAADGVDMLIQTWRRCIACVEIGDSEGENHCDWHFVKNFDEGLMEEGNRNYNITDCLSGGGGGAGGALSAPECCKFNDGR